MDDLESRLKQEFDDSPVVRSLVKDKKLFLIDSNINNSNKKTDENIKKIKQYTKETYDKEPEVEIMDYYSFIESSLGMSFSEYLQKTKDLSAHETAKFAKEQLEKSNFNPDDGVYLVNQNSIVNGVSKNKHELTKDAILNKVLASYLAKKGADSTLLTLDEESALTNSNVSLSKPFNADIYTINKFYKIGLYNSLDMLRDNSAKAHHDLLAYKNSRFIENLAGSFSTTNLQSTIPKKFAFITNKIKKTGKFDVISLNERLENIDFSKYSALFIDNTWNSDENNDSKIGGGFEFLKKLGIEIILCANTPRKAKEAINKEAITKESVKHHLNKIKNLPKTKKEYVLNVLSDIKYPKNLSKRIVHADMHLGNMVFDEKQVTGLFDFDDCFYGPKLMDIASIIRYVCFYDKKLDKKRVNIFLEEYQKYAALSKTEKANLWQITRLFNIIHYVYNLYDENNWKIKKNHEYFEEEIKK
ncbi:MAG: phosphotransferase [Candidatus Woesearchaeota archaeon]